MKFSIIAAAATAAFVAAAPSYAATTITLTGNTGYFGNTVSGPFSDSYVFTVPNSGQVGATANTTFQLNTTIALTSVLLNGTALSIVNMGSGVYFAMGSTSTILNPQTLVVNGTGAGSYSGTVSFSAAVPEVATWGMMVLGFGAIGGAMRTSRRKVVFA